MMTIANPRRRAGQRFSSALWGLLVAGVGVLLIASYSGYDIDLELATIIVLGSIGGWLVLSAAVSGIGRKREVARATAPTVEERVAPRDESGDEVEDDTDVADDSVAADEQSEDGIDSLAPEQQSQDRDRDS